MSRRMIFVLLCMLAIVFAGQVFPVKGQGADQAEVIQVGIYLIRAGTLDI
jgi:hypothetical protein